MSSEAENKVDPVEPSIGVAVDDGGRGGGRVFEFLTPKQAILSFIDHSNEENRVKRGLLTFLNSDTATVADFERILPDIKDPVLAEKISTYFNVERVLRQKAVDGDKDLVSARENALFDALTGLENRRSFDEGILSAVNRANRVGSKIFLVMIDVDFFKKVNDEYGGHPAGDYVLKELGSLLKANGLLRKSEKPFRYGGEEFAILVDGDPKDTKAHENVVKLCERVRREVQKHEFIFDGIKIPVTISLGVAGFDEFRVSKEVAKDMEPERKAMIDKSGAKKLIDLADSALYAAKGKDGNGGRNRTVLADAQKDPVYNQYQIDQAAARG